MGLGKTGLTLNPVSQGSVEVTVVQNIRNQDTKDPARTAAPGNVDIATLNNGDTIASVVLDTDNRVLLPNQTDPTENGLYLVGANEGDTVRTPDANDDDEVTNSMAVHVVEGDEQGLWVLTTSDPIEVGTTALTFVKESAGAAGMHPIDDSTPVVKDPVDDTKQIRLDAGGITAGNVRVLSMPDADITPDDAGDARTPAAHTIASHSDTTATGAELETLTDGSNADALHKHAAKFLFYADHFDNPNNADWIVNALAPVEADPTRNALNVRAFDDTTEEGIGFTVRVPAGATKMDLTLLSRAASGEAGVRTVGTKLYFRKIPEGAAVSGTWAGGDDGSKVLDDLSFPATTAFYKKAALTQLDLATEGIIADQTYQFEFTRVNPVGGTELASDLYLEEMEVEFS